jgi:hypothetical protein
LPDSFPTTQPLPEISTPLRGFTPTGSTLRLRSAIGGLPERSARFPFAPRWRRGLLRPPSDHRSSTYST